MGSSIRLRQVALVATDLAATADALQRLLDLPPAFRDPGQDAGQVIAFVAGEAEGIVAVGLTRPGAERSAVVAGVSFDVSSLEPGPLEGNR